MVDFQKKKNKNIKNKMVDFQSKLARWCISMAEFDFTLEHRPGKEHVVPDTLSRAPLPEP